MAPPPPHGKGWPRMPGAAGVMGPMYTARVSAPQGMGIYRGFRPPQDPQQVGALMYRTQFKLWKEDNF